MLHLKAATLVIAYMISVYNPIHQKQAQLPEVYTDQASCSAALVQKVFSFPNWGQCEPVAEQMPTVSGATAKKRFGVRHRPLSVVPARCPAGTFYFPQLHRCIRYAPVR